MFNRKHLVWIAARLKELDGIHLENETEYWISELKKVTPNLNEKRFRESLEVE